MVGGRSPAGVAGAAVDMTVMFMVTGARVGRIAMIMLFYVVVSVV